MHKRSVLIFSHTSYADFYILILYLLAYPHRLRRIRTLVKPQPFKYAGWLLAKLGAIPSTRVEDKNGGAVPRIVRNLTNCPECVFLISPKGTIIKGEWRSGYYHIATQLDAHMMVAGLDYELKRPMASIPIPHGEKEEDVKPQLLADLGKIVPLFPDSEVVPIRSHNQEKRSIMNRTKFLIMMGITLVTCYFTSPLVGVGLIISITNLLF